MNYEKKYRDLVEAVKELQEANPSDEGIQKWVEDNVPELKESGDERIKKIIKQSLKSYFEGKLSIGTNDTDYAECLAWLEKQGDKDKLIKELGEYKVKYTQEVLSQQLEKQSAHKSAFWSEEDEERYLSCLKRLGTGNIEQPETVNTVWLKSLKERVQPQSKQEWSEEEIENCAREAEDNNCIILAKHIRQLKSIRPQTTWKQSGEHYELEEFAKIVRGNLTGISKAVQKLFEAKYVQLTGNKMYGGFKD